MSFSISLLAGFILIALIFFILGYQAGWKEGHALGGYEVLSEIKAKEERNGE